MIGYEMGSSPTNVYTYNQDFSNERFKHECQMHIGINLTTFFAEKISSKVKFLGQSQTLTQELDLFETPTRELFFIPYCYPPCPPQQPLPQITNPWTEILQRLVHLCTSSSSP